MRKLRTYHVPISEETRAEIDRAAEAETAKIRAVSIDAPKVSSCVIARRVLEKWAADQRAAAPKSPTHAKAG